MAQQTFGLQLGHDASHPRDEFIIRIDAHCLGCLFNQCIELRRSVARTKQNPARQGAKQVGITGAGIVGHALVTPETQRYWNLHRVQNTEPGSWR